MWRTKLFKTKALRDAWVLTKGLKYEWHDVFINNGYGIEYRPLRRIY